MDRVNSSTNQDFMKTASPRSLLMAMIFVIGVPVIGTLVLGGLLPDWSWISLPFHSLLEVSGAALGMILALLILFSQQDTLTSRRMWIACALLSMPVLDIFHSCVPRGDSFVWLHSLAMLAGGFFFALTWFPEREIRRKTAWATAGAVLVTALLTGILSALFPDSLPVMMVDGSFSPLAQAINLLGGILLLLAALNFGVHYARQRNMKDLLFLFLCLLFGMSGVLFDMSSTWQAGWWLWHILRFSAYLFAFWLSLLSYRSSENELLRVNSDLDNLFHAAVDGKRLIDLDFNQIRSNDTFAGISGLSREASEKMKCYDAFHGPLCHTNDCPLIQLRSGAVESIEKEVVKIRKDGKTVPCIFKAIRLKAADGSFRGIIESFWDITDRKESERSLEKKNTSLKQLSSELEIIMDSIPGLVFYKDKENRFIRVNKYMADAHKLTKKEMEGKSCFELYPRDMAQAYLDDDLAVINSREARLNIDEPWQTEMGARWVSTSKIPFVNENDDIVGVIGVSMDVTERKQAEEALARESKLTSAINRIFRDALTCETEKDVATAALRVAEELTGSRFGYIGEINGSGLMDTIAISNPGWKDCDIIVSDAKNFIRDMPLRGIDRTTLKEGKSRIVNRDEIATHPDRTGTPQGHPPITCFLGVPVKREDKTIGMIGLANKEEGYDQQDLETIEKLSVSFYEVLLRKRMERQVKQQVELKTGQAEISECMRGDLQTDVLCQSIITYLCNRMAVPVGLLYLPGDDGTLALAAGYAYKHKKHMVSEYRPGEGLVGQAALEGKDIILAEVPENYFTIDSGLGEILPRNIYIKPIIHNGRIKAVIEMGTLNEFSEFQSLFLNAVSESIAVSLESSRARYIQKRLLEESQRLTEELQAQQEELRASNEELEEQTQRLAESEERLKTQKEELQVTNEELEEKNDLLDRQKKEVEHARKEIAEKAEDLAIASKYKSEFLANMSHELRSPLNSLLLLSQGLTQNKEGNLTREQIEAAQIIHMSGTDLLNLINEILDLSRIEAGRMDLRIGKVKVNDIADSVRSSFKHLAEEKGLDLKILMNEKAPLEIISDRKRLEQVIRNLMSNALKFTEKGAVTLTFDRPSAGIDLSKSGLIPDECLAITVGDTGIGIAPEQQKIVFGAFQQVDGGTARKYGGTGLGLSISREIAGLLGGEIQLESEPGKGATFNFYLPIKDEKIRSAERGVGSGERGMRSAERGKASLPGSPGSEFSVPHSIPDDRELLERDDRVILIIEDDPAFARILYEKCHEKGFKCLVSPTGEVGLELTGKHLPNAVILDIRLPGMDGWNVLSALKEDTRTRHIPVHIVSVEADTIESVRKGALGHAIKPLSQEDIDTIFQRVEGVQTGKPWRLLVVEDNPEIRRSIVELIGDVDVCTDESENGVQALDALRSKRYDCMVLDLGLPDMSGSELLDTAEREGMELPPIVVNTARDLTREEEMELRERAESIVIKDVRSQERLLDEVSLFLHRVVSRMTEKKQKIIKDLHDTSSSLADKKVLIVDDDMRTTFALSKLLSERGMNTLKAENGERSLQMLNREPDVDLVLMDIMMPVMDGYEAIRKIRAQERFRKLPILALTAKAMPEDREKCLQVGASDYITKPVDEARLISMMRVWLYR